MHCIVLYGPMEKPKKLPAFFQFPPPPIEFEVVSLSGPGDRFRVGTQHPYLSNKNFRPLQKLNIKDNGKKNDFRVRWQREVRF